MTALTRESVAALSGRELDAELETRVYGRSIDTQGYQCPADGRIFPPRATPSHSHPDCRGLAEMISAAHAAGWLAEIDDFGDSWHVRLSHAVDGYVDRYEGDNGSMLPEAFARALLLTTLTEAAP